MDQIIVCGGQRDLIAYALYRLGFHPRESLVVVGLNGPRRRSGLVVRVDLPPVPRVAQVLHAVVEALRRNGDGEAVVLIFSEVLGGGTDPLLGRPELAAAVRRGLRRARIGVFDVLAVSRQAFRSYLCTDPRCCPVGGTPVAEALGSATAAHMVLAGRALVGDEDALVAQVRPEPEGSRLRREVERALPGVPPCADLAARTAALGLWRRLTVTGELDAVPPAADLAALTVALEDARLRDSVLLSLVPGSGSLPDELLAGGAPVPGSGTDDAVENLLGSPPEEDLLLRGTTVLGLLARTAPAGRRCEALAMLAWAAWWSEGGVRPRLLARLALDDRPGHRLADLVVATLDAGIEPPWVRADRRAGRRAR